MTKDQMLDEIRKLSDKELVDIVNDMELRIIPDDSPLRLLSIKLHGEENGNNVMYMLITTSKLILQVMTERFIQYSPHI